MIVGRLEGLQKDHGKPLSISSDMSAKTLDYYKQKINLSFCDIKILLARRIEMKCVTEQKDLLELLLSFPHKLKVQLELHAFTPFYIYINFGLTQKKKKNEDLN